MHLKRRADAIKDAGTEFKCADQLDPAMATILLTLNLFAFGAPTIGQGAFGLKADLILKANAPPRVDCIGIAGGSGRLAPVFAGSAVFLDQDMHRLVIT